MEVNTSSETSMLESDIVNNITGAYNERLLAMSFITFKIGRSNGYFSILFLQTHIIVNNDLNVNLYLHIFAVFFFICTT